MKKKLKYIAPLIIIFSLLCSFPPMSEGKLPVYCSTSTFLESLCSTDTTIKPIIPNC